MVKKVGNFNGDTVPKFLKAYNAEMTTRDVGEAMRLKYFWRVAALSIHEEVRELQKALESCMSFEEALLEAYGYEKPEEQGQREFNQWVASAKTHRSAMKAFQEFEHWFAQLLERDRRLVGVR
mgnify:CR=1 FL=1